MELEPGEMTIEQLRNLLRPQIPALASVRTPPKFLVREHMTNGLQAVPDGQAILEGDEIDLILRQHNDLRKVWKAIEPRRNTVNLYKIDLVPPEETELAAAQAKIDWENGKEEVPWRVFLGPEFEGHDFDLMVIILPKDACRALPQGQGEVVVS